MIIRGLGEISGAPNENPMLRMKEMRMQQKAK